MPPARGRYFSKKPTGQKRAVSSPGPKTPESKRTCLDSGPSGECSICKIKAQDDPAWPYKDGGGCRCSRCKKALNNFDPSERKSVEAEIHEVTTPSYNFWRWFEDACNATESASRCVFRVWTDDIPDGWHPPVGEWREEGRFVNEEVAKVLLKPGHTHLAYRYEPKDGMEQDGFVVETSLLGVLAKQFPVVREAKMITADAGDDDSTAITASGSGGDSTGRRGTQRTLTSLRSSLLKTDELMDQFVGLSKDDSLKSKPFLDHLDVLEHYVNTLEPKLLDEDERRLVDKGKSDLIRCKVGHLFMQCVLSYFENRDPKKALALYTEAVEKRGDLHVPCPTIIFNKMELQRRVEMVHRPVEFYTSLSPDALAKDRLQSEDIVDSAIIHGAKFLLGSTAEEEYSNRKSNLLSLLCPLVPHVADVLAPMLASAPLQTQPADKASDSEDEWMDMIQFSQDSKNSEPHVETVLYGGFQFVHVSEDLRDEAADIVKIAAPTYFSDYKTSYDKLVLDPSKRLMQKFMTSPVGERVIEECKEFASIKINRHSNLISLGCSGRF